MLGSRRLRSTRMTCWPDWAMTHRQIRGCRGRVFVRAWTGDHDRADAMLELRELQPVLDDPERLGARTRRLGQRGRLLGLHRAAVGLGNLTEQRHSQARSQLIGGAHPRVEGLADKRHRDTQRQPDDEAQDDVALGPRLYEGGAAGGADHRRARADRLQRLQFLEITHGPPSAGGTAQSPRYLMPRAHSAFAGRRRSPPKAPRCRAARRYSVNCFAYAFASFLASRRTVSVTENVRSRR